ncbi:hypothetical protein QTP88_006298 [Uroleucon formosanum]
MDIICNTSLFNAFSIYKEFTGNSTAIIKFKDDIINGFIQKSNSVPEVLEVPEPYDEHKLVNKKKEVNVTIATYIFLEQKERRYQERKPRVSTICPLYDSYFCLDCFFRNHKYIK